MLGSVVANATSNLPLDSAKDRAAVLVNAISEVLAGHADSFALPALKLAFVDEIPFLHVLAE